MVLNRFVPIIQSLLLAWRRDPLVQMLVLLLQKHAVKRLEKSKSGKVQVSVKVVLTCQQDGCEVKFSSTRACQKHLKAKHGVTDVSVPNHRRQDPCR